MPWEPWVVAALVLIVGWWLWNLWSRIRIERSLGDPAADRATTRTMASEANREVHRLVAEFGRQARSAPPRKRLAALRVAMDNFGGAGSRDPAELGVRIERCDAGGIPAEWVLAPDSDPDRRLLYLHGGAFFVGSPLSHRPLTAAMALRTRCSVLVIDYRLLPEHKRIDGIVDCQRAYRWILEHGPLGKGRPKQVFVAGDSAGGNLTLVLIAWIRDHALRQVDGAAALSPATDSTFRSPSLRRNIRSDPMLGPGLGALMKIPRLLLLLLTAIAARMRPNHPLISPFHGDLSGLPPTLIQASEVEMLFDDARRYVRKAEALGSPVRLQTWPGMVHVWQIFHHVLPEANEALDEIARFFDRSSGRPRLAGAPLEPDEKPIGETA